MYLVDLDLGINNYVGNLGKSFNVLGFSNDGILYGVGGFNFYFIDISLGVVL